MSTNDDRREALLKLTDPEDTSSSIQMLTISDPDVFALFAARQIVNALEAAVEAENEHPHFRLGATERAAELDAARELVSRMVDRLVAEREALDSCTCVYCQVAKAMWN